MCRVRHRWCRCNRGRRGCRHLHTVLHARCAHCLELDHFSRCRYAGDPLPWRRRGLFVRSLYSWMCVYFLLGTVCLSMFCTSPPPDPVSHVPFGSCPHNLNHNNHNLIAGELLMA